MISQKIYIYVSNNHLGLKTQDSAQSKDLPVKPIKSSSTTVISSICNTRQKQSRCMEEPAHKIGPHKKFGCLTECTVMCLQEWRIKLCV